MTENGNRALVMTVGTGDMTKLEETLFVPLRKSIATDAWTRVVLLPSTVTETFAETVRKGIAGVEVAVHPLPEGHENDADRAYAHFDSVLGEVLREFPPGCVVVDFTRGTKAMSAALVLATARREIPRLRYITGERDERGMVKAGSEKVRGIRTTVVAGHRRLDLARDLMRRGSFSAAGTVLSDTDCPSPDFYPPDLIEIACAVRTVARFYGAWDRLDYAAASRVDIPAPPNHSWKAPWPTSAAHEWVRTLAKEPPRSDCVIKADRLRRLIVDLLANGERRLRQGQHEDALVRAYRVVELIGQARLFDQGLDSADLDRNHSAVQTVQKKIEKKNQTPLADGRNGELQAGRFQVARILMECGDPLAERLLKFEDEALLKPTLRNNSVLIHGFFASAPEDSGSLHHLFNDLIQLSRDDHPNAVDEWLSVARTPAFTDPSSPASGISAPVELPEPVPGQGARYRSEPDGERIQ